MRNKYYKCENCYFCDNCGCDKICDNFAPIEDYMDTDEYIEYKTEIDRADFYDAWISYSTQYE